MGDDDQPARVAREVVLEPEEGLQVEVVRRLVQEEEGRLGHEEPGQVGPHDPAAGEGLRQLVAVALAEAEAGQDLLGARLEGPVDVVVVVGLRDELLAAGRDLDDGLVGDRRAFLGQEAEVGAALPFDRAVVRRLLA